MFLSCIIFICASLSRCIHIYNLLRLLKDSGSPLSLYLFFPLFLPLSSFSHLYSSSSPRYRSPSIEFSTRGGEEWKATSARFSEIMYAASVENLGRLCAALSLFSLNPVSSFLKLYFYTSERVQHESSMRNCISQQKVACIAKGKTQKK